MRLATFNEFNGDAIADSLIAHDDLWEGWILDRAAYGAEYHRQRIGQEAQKQIELGQKPEEKLHVEPIDFIRLRDIGAGYWNVDTLFILPIEGKEKDLELLAHKEWYADEVDWVDGQDCRRPVLRVWWD
jgi:hypothetical protein